MYTYTALQLHTCFIDIESGTFVAKAMVSKFLQNYDKTSVVDAYADMYFMMYINQVPYQLEGNDNEMEAPAKELTEKETEHMVSERESKRPVVQYNSGAKRQHGTCI